MAFERHRDDRGTTYSVEVDGLEGTGIDLYGLYLLIAEALEEQRSKTQADEIEDELRRIREYGANPDYFRRELAESSALPYRNEFRDEYWLDILPKYWDLPQMRLYLWVCGSDVVLFSGGVKTTNDPKDCPNVRDAFLQAGEFSVRLRDQLGNDLRIIDDRLHLNFGRGMHTPPAGHAF